MTGLLEHRRDATLPARAGEPDLAPPSGDQFTQEFLPRLLPESEGARCELVYARWKPGVATTAAYRIDLSGESHLAVWRRHAQGKWDRRDAAVLGKGRLGDQHETRLVHDVDVEAGRLVYLFPADPDLPGAPRATDVGRFARWFDENDLRPQWRVRRKHFDAQLVRYRPGARAVWHAAVKLMGPGGEKERLELGVRALPVERAGSVWRRRCGFEAANGGSGPFPALFAREERTGLVYERWLDVEVRASDDHSDPAPVGAALAQLHSLPTAHGADLARAPSMESLDPWFAPFAELAGHRAPAVPFVVRAWTHGDFHPDCTAVARVGGALHLLDADSLALGDPREDVADWVGGALAGATLRGESCSYLETLQVFEQGYCSAQRATPVELAHFVARALRRRAAGCVRRLEEDALQRAAQLLVRATAIATEARS